MRPSSNELDQPIGFPKPGWRVPERPPRTTFSMPMAGSGFDSET